MSMRRFLISIAVGVFASGIVFWALPASGATAALVGVIAGSFTGLLAGGDWYAYGTFFKGSAQKLTSREGKQNLWEFLVASGSALRWIYRYLLVGWLLTLKQLFNLKNEATKDVWAVWLIVFIPIAIIAWELHLFKAFSVQIAPFSGQVPIWLLALGFCWALFSTVVSLVSGALFLVVGIMYLYIEANGIIIRSGSDLSRDKLFLIGWAVEDHSRGILRYVGYVLYIRTINAVRFLAWLVKMVAWMPTKLLNFEAGAVVTIVALFSAVHLLLGFTFGWIGHLNYWLSLCIVDLAAVVTGRVVYPQLGRLASVEKPKLIEIEHEALSC